MTLYLKYRPQTLNELDIEEVRDSLKKILSSGKIPHALIFSGPKGTGKTSAARILAKVVNCEDPQKDGEPCNRCDQCLTIARGENLDVLELDAASHRGIDDVRALREAVKLASTKAKKKVYIIDEAHMLTLEASNALLKTLEEPPPHVVFILATTNPEKLIPTIRSRATEIIFRKALVPEIVRSLKRVIKGEKLDAEEHVLEMLAQASDGSFRDAVKILEQIILEGKKLVDEEVSEFLFTKKVFVADEFLKLLADSDAKNALLKVEEALSKGMSIKSLLNLLVSRLRKALLAKYGLEGEDLSEFSKNDIIALLKLFDKVALEVSSAVLEQVPLETAIVEWCAGKSRGNLKKESRNFEREKESPHKPETEILSETSEVKEDFLEEKADINKDEEEKTKKAFKKIDESLWKKILTEIKPKNASTEALLRASQPLSYKKGTLTLGVYYRFHKERLETHPHRDILEKTLGEVLGDSVKVLCILTPPPKGAVLTEPERGKDKEDRRPDDSLSDANSVLTKDNEKDIIEIAREIFGS